jgi:hypothetical protein
MNFKNYLEPFVELLLIRAPFDFKLMRFFGRIPFVRNYSFDASYEKKLEDSVLMDFETDRSCKQIVREIRAHGYCGEIRISERMLFNLKAFVVNADFVDRKTRTGNYKIDPDNLINPGGSCSYSVFNPHLSNSELLELTRTELKMIADAYLGADSLLMNSQIWVTFPTMQNEYNPEFGFHYDLDDYRFLKLFVYLNDVDADTGPHVILKDSHKFNSVYRFFNRRIKSLKEANLKLEVVKMLGKNGACFFEDTLCYHKGSVPKKARLVLQVQFSVTSNEWNS